MSFRIDRSNLGSGALQFRFDVEGIQSPNYVFLDGAMVIDLTADFSSGNKPTKEWCDANIPFIIGSAELISINGRTKINGSIKEITKGYTKVDGVWKSISSNRSKI